MSSRVRRRRVPLASPAAGDPDREIRLTLWHGSDHPETEGPLVIYSHGQDGSAAEARDLAAALASRGCTVAAPDHRDRRTVRHGAGGDVHARYAHRVDDLRRTLDHLEPPDSGRRVLLVGFSLGAYPALVLAGLPPGPGDSRVVGLVLLTPAVFMFDDEAFGALTVPSLSLYGEAEHAVVRGGVSRRERALRIASRLGDRGELAEIAGAGHLDLVRHRSLRDHLPPARRIRRQVARRVVEFVVRVTEEPAQLMRDRPSP